MSDEIRPITVGGKLIGECVECEHKVCEHVCASVTELEAEVRCAMDDRQYYRARVAELEAALKAEQDHHAYDVKGLAISAENRRKAEAERDTWRDSSEHNADEAERAMERADAAEAERDAAVKERDRLAAGLAGILPLAEALHELRYDIVCDHDPEYCHCDSEAQSIVAIEAARAALAAAEGQR